jgi:hypothetical protein
MYCVIRKRKRKKMIRDGFGGGAQASLLLETPLKDEEDRLQRGEGGRKRRQEEGDKPASQTDSSR